MSYTNLNYHIVFSTKERRPFMTPQILPRVSQYVGGVIRNLEGVPLAVNGMANHLHIATVATPKIAISDLLRTVKANTSRWIHDTFADLQDFGWQDGYSAFTVSRSGRETVVAYVMNQQEHHKKMTFQEELIALLDKHGIEYDERHIWK